ncbi:hypothetical protein pb186bvf_003069 [Paramecium bursaria]
MIKIENKISIRNRVQTWIVFKSGLNIAIEIFYNLKLPLYINQFTFNQWVSKINNFILFFEQNNTKQFYILYQFILKFFFYYFFRRKKLLIYMQKQDVGKQNFYCELHSDCQLLSILLGEKQTRKSRILCAKCMIDIINDQEKVQKLVYLQHFMNNPGISLKILMKIKQSIIGNREVASQT